MSVATGVTDVDSADLELLRESAARTAVSGEPDQAALLVLRSSGLLGLPVPAAHGGHGGGAREINRVVSRVATANPSLSIVLFQHCAVAARIAEWGTVEQQERFLPPMARGEVLAASAWSETGVGAAKKRLGTTATRQADGGWLLDGAKAFTTGAGIADLYLVLAQTSAPVDDPRSTYGSVGQSFFLVDARAAGVHPDLSLDLVGMRGSATGFLSLRECAVGADASLGPIGEAPRIIAGVRATGATLGAVSVGIAEAVLELTLRHLDSRGLLAAHATRHRMVELGSRVEAARAIVERAGALTSADPSMTTLHSKLFASAVGEEVALDAARLLSSAGYVAGHQLNSLLADARAVALMGPTDELCRELVAAPWA
ncbi:acyl-CoA dehydrogenase family protein [Actinokineospora enzanensis]|uniref:acyl-CoA dehydrogenase family protein n=1 Tax=Actinokineospora enzanensis TaxID=155975 RepID=UPI0003A93C16|nr:acyl-CoA dehydrogenase family protein [Actinokineospora enzanensis]